MTNHRLVAISAVFIAGFLGLASRANALDTSSGEFLGSIKDGEPSSTANEVIFINNLIDTTLNTSRVVDSGGSIGSHTYTRTNNTCGGGTCPDATDTGASSSGSNPSNTGIDVTGFTYLLAKYDGPNGGDYVWYVANLSGTVDVPANLDGDPFCTTGSCGLSHFELFNNTTTTDGTGTTDVPVPEPSGLLLVGTGLVVLGRFGRTRLQRK